MTTYTIDIYSHSSTTFTLLHTDTDVTTARGTFRRSAVGEGSLTFPASNYTLDNNTNRGRIVHVYTVRDDGLTVNPRTLTVALFVIKQRSHSQAQDGNEYITVAGPGIEHLIGNRLIYGEIHNGSQGPALDDIQQIIDYHPFWSLVAGSQTGTAGGTKHSLQGVNVLNALKAAADQSGELWRLARQDLPKKQIEWLPVPVDDASFEMELVNNKLTNPGPTTGVIVNQQHGIDRSETLTRVRVFGAGRGENRLTLAGATWPPPAGYSIYPDASMIVNDARELTGEYNEREVVYSTIRLPKLVHFVQFINTTDDYFRVQGAHTTVFVPGYTFKVEGSTSNDGTYTVASRAYSEEFNNTTIWVNEEIPSTQADGEIVPLQTTLDATTQATANALAKRAYYHLRDRDTGQDYSRVRAIYNNNAMPGDRVRIHLDSYNYSYIPVMQVISVTYSIDRQSGIRYMDLVAGPLANNRPPLTEEQAAEELVKKIEDAYTHTDSDQVSTAGEVLPTMESHLLANDPHPAYLRADGSRNLIGNLIVGAGVTIDGVDLSAHANDVAAHHDPVTAGNGITVAAQQVAVNPGDGLAISAGLLTLDYGAGLAINLGGSLIHDTGNFGDVHTNYPEIAVNETITGIWTFATNINVNGNLTAGSATINGLLEVTGTNNAEFGTGFVYDGTQKAIGLGGNPVLTTWPDPQFALDVNGSMRAWGYIVGKHALQIPDAQHIFHFDGPLGNDDYNGTLASHRGLTPDLITDGSEDRLPKATFRPGKFGKALVRGPNGINLVLNPTFGTLSLWSNAGADGGYTTVEQSTDAKFGTYSVRVVSPAAPTGQNYILDNINVSASTEYTLSAYVKTTSTDFTLNGLEFDGGGFTGITRQVIASGSGEWERLSVTFTTSATTTYIQIRLRSAGSAGQVEALWDAVQLEQSAYITPYFDGSMPDCAWTGTAHASTSTRANEAINYLAADAFGTDEPTVFTISLWAKTASLPAATPSYILIAPQITVSDFIYLRTYNGTWFFRFNNEVSSVTATADEWTHLAIVADGTNYYFYVNGKYERQNPIQAYTNPLSLLHIGGFGATTPFNGQIDDLAIIDRAMDVDPTTYECDEVRAIYESNAPVFAETSTFSWHDPTLSIRVDDTGLFARSNDAAAEAVFGLATQAISWGGQSMDVGDLMLGNANTGSANIFWDRSAGTFAFRGGTTTQAYLDASGKLWAAGGSAVFSEKGLNLRGALRLEFQRRDNVNALAGVTDANGFHIINLRGGSTELVSNGNFEGGVSGWSWDGTSGSIAQSAAEAFLGDYSLLLNYTELGALQSEYAMSDSFAISGSNLYLSLAAKGDPDAASLVIEWRDSGNSLISRFTQTISISPIWKTFSTYASIPGTAAYARVGVRGESGTSYGTHNIYIDDVSARTFGADIRTIEMLDGFGTGDLTSASSIVLTADAIVADGELVTTGDLSLTSASGSRFATFSISVADLTLDTDLKFPTDTNGVILVDRTTGTSYRLYVNSGSLAIESI